MSVGIRRWLRRSVGVDGQVYAIEPNPDNARLIAHTIERNRLSNVRLVPIALGESTGFAAYRSAIGSNGGFLDQDERDSLDPSVTIVPTIRFDDLHIPRRCGQDRRRRRRAHRVSRRGRDDRARPPVIVFEFCCLMSQWIGGVAPRDHLKMFESCGYELWMIERPTGTLIAVGDIDGLLGEWGSPPASKTSSQFVAERHPADPGLTLGPYRYPYGPKLSKIVRMGQRGQGDVPKRQC